MANHYKLMDYTFLLSSKENSGLVEEICELMDGESSENLQKFKDAILKVLQNNELENNFWFDVTNSLLGGTY